MERYARIIQSKTLSKYSTMIYACNYREIRQYFSVNNCLGRDTWGARMKHSHSLDVPLKRWPVAVWRHLATAQCWTLIGRGFTFAPERGSVSAHGADIAAKGGQKLRLDVRAWGGHAADGRTLSSQWADRAAKWSRSGRTCTIVD